MAIKLIIPNLDNATPSMLIDTLGRLSIVENYAKKQRGMYKEALYARLPENKVGDHLGEVFVGSVSTYDDTRVDVEKLKTEYPDVYQKVLRTKPITKMTTKPQPGQLKPDGQKLVDELYAELGLED